MVSNGTSGKVPRSRTYSMCLRPVRSNGWNSESVRPSNSSGFTPRRSHSVEGRGRFHPFAVEVELAIGVPTEHVGFHVLVEARGGHVVLDVGKAEPARHAEHARRSGEHGCL